MKQLSAGKKKKKKAKPTSLQCFVRPAFWLFRQHRGFLLMLPCEVTSPQQPAGMGPPQTLPTGKRGLLAAGRSWDGVCEGSALAQLLWMGLVRVPHWHNSSGWDLPWRADAHPSPGWNSSWSQACPHLSEAAPVCCGMSTRTRLG